MRDRDTLRDMETNEPTIATETPILLPCPFCGGTACGPKEVPARKWADNPPMRETWIHCAGCGVSIAKAVGMAERYVIEAWNRRVYAEPSAPANLIAGNAASAVIEKVPSAPAASESDQSVDSLAPWHIGTVPPAPAQVASETTWLIFYEDADMRPEVFRSEAGARRRYAEAHISWSCHLFVLVTSESPWKTPVAQPEPAVSAACPARSPAGVQCEQRGPHVQHRYHDVFGRHDGYSWTDVQIKSE